MCLHREEESQAGAREQKSKPAAGRAQQNNAVVDPPGRGPCERGRRSRNAVASGSSASATEM